jgi:hypothetical protein
MWPFPCNAPESMKLAHRGIVVAASVLSLGLPAQAMATRYVTPGGTPAGNCQTVATGCDLQTAIQGVVSNMPSNGEEVIVEPGSYSLSTQISEGAPNLNIHGVLGQPRPVINQSAPVGQLGGLSSTLSYLDFEAGGTTFVNQGGGLIDRVIVRGAGNGNFTCQCYGGTIRDSLFVSTGQTAALGVTSNGGTGALTLRNVTAITTNPTGTAITVSHQGPQAISYDAYNVIARNVAGGTDVGAFGDSATIAATITFHHSNYATADQGAGGLVQDAPGDPHQSAPPLFTNASAGDLSEVQGSPTIDAGLTDPSNGPLDFAGNPRSSGGGTDIGAYELLVPVPPASPPASHKKKCKKHKKHKKRASAAKKCKKHKRHKK